MKEIAVGEAPAGAQGAPSDGDLLGCFAVARDEAAFRALVERHGGMVYYVCRSQGAPSQDAGGNGAPRSMGGCANR